MKRIFSKSCFLALALSLAPLTAQAPPKWITEAPGRKQFPTIEALILKHEVNLELRADGTWKKRVLIATKVLRQLPYNRQGLADPRLHYDAANQQIKVLQARVWTPTGRVKDTAKNGFNHVFPGALVQAPDLATFRDLVVTHVGICEGCVTVLEYELIDQKPIALAFQGGIPAQLVFPILDQQITITTPKNHELQANLLTETKAVANSRHETNTLDGKNIHCFTRRGLIAPASTPVDIVVFSTAERGKIHNLLHQRLDKIGELPEKISESCLNELGDHPWSAIKKVDQVASFFNKHLRLQAWPLDLLHYRIRPATKIWQSTYATLPELGAMIRASLLKIGFTRVNMIPVVSRPRVTMACPNLADSIWLVAVDKQKQITWLKVGGRPGNPAITTLAGSSALLGKLPTVSDISSGQDAGTIINGHLSLKANGSLKAFLEITLTGCAFNPQLAALKGIEPQLEQAATIFGNSTAKKISVLELTGKKAKGKVSCTGNHKGTDQAGLLHFKMPLPVNSPATTITNLHDLTFKGITRIPGGFKDELMTLAISLPRGLTLIALPPLVQASNRLGSVTLKAWHDKGRRQVIYTYQLTLNCSTVKPVDRPLLGELIAPLLAPAARTFLFESKSEK